MESSRAGAEVLHRPLHCVAIANAITYGTCEGIVAERGPAVAKLAKHLAFLRGSDARKEEEIGIREFAGQVFLARRRREPLLQECEACVVQLDQIAYGSFIAIVSGVRQPGIAPELVLLLKGDVMVRREHKAVVVLAPCPHVTRQRGRFGRRRAGRSGILCHNVLHNRHRVVELHGAILQVWQGAKWQLGCVERRMPDFIDLHPVLSADQANLLATPDDWLVRKVDRRHRCFERVC